MMDKDAWRLQPCRERARDGAASVAVRVL
jgi:hypothetical protein